MIHLHFSSHFLVVVLDLMVSLVPDSSFEVVASACSFARYSSFVDPSGFDDPDSSDFVVPFDSSDFVVPFDSFGSFDSFGLVDYSVSLYCSDIVHYTLVDCLPNHHEHIRVS